MKILGQEIAFNAQGESDIYSVEAHGIQFAFMCTQGIWGNLQFNIALGHLRTQAEINREFLTDTNLDLDQFILEQIFSPDIAKLIADKFKW